MDNVCYVAVIRQQMCQSGTPVSRENVYSNLSQNTAIPLLNGYTLKISQGTNNSSDLQFINEMFGINLIFNISNGSAAVFDLPVENTIFRVTIFIQVRCCSKCCS